MDLARSWLASFAAYLVTMWGTSVLGRAGGDQAAYGSLLGRVLWLYLPLLVAYAIITGAAAGAHTRPRREKRIRHLVAVLPVPVATILLSTILGATGATQLSGLVLSVICAGVGTMAGWVGADLLWLWFTRDRQAYF